jgi:hypothetical protein
MYRCCACDFRHAAEMHEPIPGWGKRQVCIDYKIQVPLCRTCHSLAHGKPVSDLSPFKGRTQKEIAIMLCENILGIDYYMTLRAVNDPFDRGYLAQVKDQCAEKIKQYLI